MLNIILGPPRSGKTYKAVKIIYDEYQLYKENKSKYRFIYTNINGLKFDEFEGFVKKFDKLDFLEAVNQENLLNKRHETSFIDVGDDYDSYALKNGIYEDYHHSLIILDEAYNVFDKKFNDSLGRFLSYHGHFGIDIYFILQSKRQTNREYLVHTELMYFAQPSGKRILSKIFRYKIYSTCDLKRDNLIKTENLKFDKKISDLYSSGSKQIYKSYATSKIIFLIFFIIFSYFLYQFLKPNSTNENLNQPAKVDLNDTNSSRISSSKNIIDSDIKYDIFSLNKSYFKVTCFSSSCKFRGYNLDLALNSFLEVLATSNCYIFLMDKKSVNYIDYYASCPMEFQKFLKILENTKQGVHNETFTENNFIGSTFR
ncbi:zonular occludens toxin [Campylobacter sp. FMV-PI01]|uniref:Zonular occludens toxin n=1 Tax=Campylobacter portucalensis TaxID=2608384 RepID=A0A6L5WJS0_9BACT|nr:zonular occludens toxin domain-containing protein [Campylobacter portucalensis]MSN95991.1 zonular occludens toxin [Campylobacter portucalensis]